MSCLRNFKSILPIFVTLCLMLFCAGCEHRKLEELNYYENYFVKIYFDENIRNVSYGFYDESKKRPEYASPQSMRIVFCDEVTGKAVVERYLSEYGKDERGYYIQGLLSVPFGKYNVLAYNFDTKNTQVKSENDYEMMTACTTPLGENEINWIFSSRGEGAEDDEPIYKQPDHLFVAKVEGVEVTASHYKDSPDTLKTAEGLLPTASTMVNTYYFQFNVKGVEYVRSAVALVTGMAGSKILHSGEMVSEDVASIYFGLNNGKDKRSTATEETSVAYSTFNTFGKLPHTEGYINITFEFKTIYNTVQTETIHITDMFETQQVKENQWIIIDKLIEIVPPEGAAAGGLSPGVNDWEEIESEIII
ncbi:MAG: DUF5119 domain-containing protein [Bacteroidaceae bacterium]|nr:DUF5119 domain-containing protein [Bacteroidaceae bacterium]